eukprot:CAMPEP_0183718428 /NCGR_PEP_ID=MMETSP0737-20130205/11687_1 /TAXON_ID=385413 /ORGANISM="Thalassiosira miniscula, Strain CCMP1093" /LENGTH=617 /DNA_ID=CAMNT_0025947983 /DNA_START=636 /DNA_END=2489 /DNA_ORIENTATION=-
MNENNTLSTSSLMQQLATRLVQGQQLNEADGNGGDATYSKPIKACIAIAGGGSGAPAAIASIPGASSLLLESIVCYDRRSFAEFISQNSGNDDSLWMDLESGDLSSSSSSSQSSSSSSNTGSSRSSNKAFQFSSTQAAILLSRAALQRSRQFTPGFQEQSLQCLGVGCTSSLVGKVSAKGEVEGRKGRKSRAYLACSTLTGGTRVWEVQLDCTEGIARRTREQEESVVSNLLLVAMVQYREVDSLFNNKPLLDGTIKDVILNKEGDTIIETVMTPSSGKKHSRKSPADGASQIIDGDANIVALVPTPTGKDHSTMQALFSDKTIPFPQDVLIVPGSFNPPHAGHVGLANAAVEALKKIRQREASAAVASGPYYSQQSSLSSSNSPSTPESSSVSSSILKSLWDTVHSYSEEQYTPTVFFEMSVTNADKPPLDPTEVERRVNLFTSSPILSSVEMPQDWGVILTNAPLFSQKTEILDKLLLISDGVNNPVSTGTSSFGSDVSNNPQQTKQEYRRKMSFVLGTDTMVRIINPKYYGNKRENMIAALQDMKDRGVHFIVGGRLEQGTESGSKLFVNGEEEVKSLPLDIQEMFTLLMEEEFRLDISSTELRKRLEGKSAQS